MKFLQFIFQHKFISFLAILIFVIIVVFIFSKEANNSSNITGPSWNSLTPGQSSLNDVIKVLGTPISTTQTQNGQELYFKSASASRNNIAVVQNDKLQLIRTVNLVNGKSVTDLTELYGTPQITLYGTLSNAGYYLFASPSEGIAYFANPVAGNVLEIWYFVPTTQQVFLNTFGSSFSLNLPTPRGE